MGKNEELGIPLLETQCNIFHGGSREPKDEPEIVQSLKASLPTKSLKKSKKSARESQAPGLSEEHVSDEESPPLSTTGTSPLVC